MGRSTVPAFLSELAVALAAALAERTALDPQEAGRLGVEVAQVVVGRFADQEIYIPRCSRWHQGKRNAAILRDYQAGGRSQAELAARYHLSQQRISQILGALLPPATPNH